MSREIIQSVEYVSGIWSIPRKIFKLKRARGGMRGLANYCSTPRFAIPFEELEKLMADKDIKVDRDFIKKEYVPRCH